MVNDNTLQNIVLDQAFFSWSIIGIMSHLNLDSLKAYKEPCEKFSIPLSANPTKWPNILKQFVSSRPKNCF